MVFLFLLPPFFSLSLSSSFAYSFSFILLLLFPPLFFLLAFFLFPLHFFSLLLVFFISLTLFLVVILLLFLVLPLNSSSSSCSSSFYSSPLPLPPCKKGLRACCSALWGNFALYFASLTFPLLCGLLWPVFAFHSYFCVGLYFVVGFRGLSLKMTSYLSIYLLVTHVYLMVVSTVFADYMSIN